MPERGTAAPVGDTVQRAFVRCLNDRPHYLPNMTCLPSGARHRGPVAKAGWDTCREVGMARQS